MDATGYPPHPPYGREAAVSVHRFVNDEIAKTARPFDDESTEFEFLCECGDLKCRRTVRMTLATYHASAAGSVIGHG